MHVRRASWLVAALVAGSLAPFSGREALAAQGTAAPEQSPPQTRSTGQPTVRVTRDRVTIWRSDFRVVAEVVRVGSVLTVVGRRGDWFEVILPFGAGIAGVETGFIHKGNIEVTSGRLPDLPESRGQDPVAAAQPSARTIGIWGFGHVGYTRFAAHDSFQAVLGQAGGGIFGGGAEVRIGRGFFVGGTIEHFSKTGERVFVLDQDVFKLGISDDISVLPITVTAGWRFAHERATPYVGGGVGTVSYKETSSFADASENLDQRFTSYHVLGGIDFRNGWLATAFEVQYSRVPDALGVGGVSAAFAEHDLGGWATRVKIMVGK